MTTTATNTVTITVNGTDIEAEAGQTILAAATKAGIEIPSLCHDPRVKRPNATCGLCVVEVGEDNPRDVKACLTPVTEGLKITTHNQRLEDYRKVRLEQLLCDHNADCVAPCVEACPANIDIQLYLRHVANRNYQAAIRVIKDRNPFPSVCGRVCPHPCEAACRRNLVDEPVAINHVKRFVADWDAAQDTPWTPRKAEASGKRIAIVGAGPSGLTAAYYSAIKGHDVTVFEKQDQPGGMMRYGIPEYRLPKATLDHEIDIIRSLGVRIVTGKSLGRHITLADLQADFDAVYLAIGSWRATPLRMEGENLDGVWLGINYLEAVTRGDEIPLGRTVVIGGGNTAIDCARTALRTGADKVTLMYRRTRDQMPAEPIEVHDALAEGVEMLYLTAPDRITTDANGVKQVHCLRMELGEPDRSGRRRPVPIEGSDITVEADTIIGAIGQSTDTGFLYNDMPVRMNKWGDIDIAGRTQETSEDKIFAGGDCATGPATVIQAIAAGRRAAEAIDQFVDRGYVRPGHVDYSCSRGTNEDLPRDEFETVPKLARTSMPEIEVPERVDSFIEVATGLTEEEARAEAARCLKCGCSRKDNCDLRHAATEHDVVFSQPLHVRPRDPIITDHPFIVRDNNKCISCGRCIAACAEVEGVGVLAYQFNDGILKVGTHNGEPLSMTDCVSCGQCVRACPTGALDYNRERNRVFRAINDPTKTVVGFVAPAVRTVLAAEFGIDASEIGAFMAGLLRQMGFDKVFDFTFAADLTIMEEATEFLGRVQNGGVMPQFTSCCPGWVNFVERRYPALIPHLSSCKSPQQMMGATVKNHFAPLAEIELDDLYVVSIVPCIAKKGEAARPEFAPNGIRDVDAVLTTTELLEMVKMLRCDRMSVTPGEFDDPYKKVSGAGVLFGASGGVAIAAMRMAAEILTGDPLTDAIDLSTFDGDDTFKTATIDAGETQVRVAVISGLGNAEPLIKQVIAGEDIGYDLVEIMACPGGCINGAGHPVVGGLEEVIDRQKVLVDIDRNATLRTSQGNPDLLRLYDEFFGEPNSELAHKLLHTSFAPFRS